MSSPKEEGKMTESQLRKDFSTITLVMIPVAIAINIAIGQIIVLLKLPIYLDSIGTVLVGVLCGPLAGLVTGLATNLIWGLSGLNPIYTPYFIVGGIIGLMAGIFAQIGWFKKLYLWVIAGLITGLVAALLSAPISAYLYGGVTGAGTDLVVAFFRAAGASVIQAALGQGIVSDPVDKMVTFLLVFVIVLGLPTRFVARFPRASSVIGAGR
jgi:energy-coupling factor transport system substrate-specific component